MFLSRATVSCSLMLDAKFVKVKMLNWLKFYVKLVDVSREGG